MFRVLLMDQIELFLIARANFDESILQSTDWQPNNNDKTLKYQDSVKYTFPDNSPFWSLCFFPICFEIALIQTGFSFSFFSEIVSATFRLHTSLEVSSCFANVESNSVLIPLPRSITIRYLATTAGEFEKDSLESDNWNQGKIAWNAARTRDTYTARCRSNRWERNCELTDAGKHWYDDETRRQSKNYEKESRMKQPASGTPIFTPKNSVTSSLRVWISNQ